MTLLVHQDGVEGTLQRLFRHGISLTGKEFKDRRPLMRGCLTTSADPAQLRNPISAVRQKGVDLDVLACPRPVPGACA